MCTYGDAFAPLVDKESTKVCPWIGAELTPGGRGGRGAGRVSLGVEAPVWPLHKSLTTVQRAAGPVWCGGIA